jgi:hypothetical protein
MRFPLFCLFVALLLGSARAAEPFFKKNDVIALVGGEDMVVASEYGYLELLLVRALPDYHLRFRNLAREGDTVFEQQRDLNFPSWEEALDKIGATVVICQFGQMESLAGKEKLPEFIEAYEKLIERFSDGGKRRIALLTPTRNSTLNEAGESYFGAIREIASKEKAALVDLSSIAILDAPMQRDGIHLTSFGHQAMAFTVLQDLVPIDMSPGVKDSEMPLLKLIVAKNKLWFDYWRVQNWAFLAGDRTNQPSSRDHLDPSKRWFPAEREEFLPLIEAKEREIDALAQKLAQP